MGVDRFSRNEALFGAEGQRHIASTRVAVAGVGGLGAPVIQQLAYLGVKDFGLIEFDVVSDSSLNRLIGAVDADVAVSAKKLDIAERLIKSVQPSAVVRRVDDKVNSDAAASMIGDADIVFGCLDRDLARLQLTGICSRYAKPLFDLATDTGGTEGEPWYGGRVVFCDGMRCLVCLDLLDQDQMRLDAMSPDQRAAHDAIYGVRHEALEGTGPMVVSVNGAVASIAVTEFMAHVTGLRPVFPSLIYRADQQNLRRSLDEPEPGCYYCGQWGQTSRR